MVKNNIRVKRFEDSAKRFRKAQAIRVKMRIKLRNKQLIMANKKFAARQRASKNFNTDSDRKKEMALRKLVSDHTKRGIIESKKRIPPLKKRISLLQRQLAQEQRGARGLR